jgi:hypothetical protein
MDSRDVAEELFAIGKRIDRCLDSETASRQTALEDVSRLLAQLRADVKTGAI